jgi:predicted permease
MRALRAWAIRMMSLVDGGRREREIDDEIESHLALHVDDNIRAGMSPVEARRAAVLALGGIEGLKDAQRDRSGLPSVQHAARDVRYAIRVLRRTPVFTAITLVTLALGIGANVAMFTIINAVLLRPLPYAEPERLTLVWGTNARDGEREVSISYPDFEAWRSGRSFEAMAAFTSRAVTLGGGDLPELVPAIQTTPQLFRVLRVDPVAGRVFDAADRGGEIGAPAVLSDAASERLFGGPAEAVGRTITVNQQPHVVVGVVPASMHFIPSEIEEVYTLLPRETNREHGYLRVVARLRQDVSVAEAQAEMDVVAGQLAAAFPRSNAGTGASVVTLTSAMGAPVREGLLILLALVSAVLLIACTNVANLLLARNASRQHELAVRVSLGASRRRIVQQLLIESLMLALAGGLAGLFLAYVLVGGLKAVLAGAVPIPRVERIGIDTAVLGFTALVSMATGLLFGIVPAMLAAPRREAAALRHITRAVTGGRAARHTRFALVVLETAIALVLLAAGAMLARSFVALRSTPPGFAGDHVLAAGLRMPDELAPGGPRAAFFEDLRARMEAIPGVRSVGFVSNLPMGGSRDSLQFRLIDRPGSKPVSVDFNIAGPGYFRTMGIPILAGREFTSDDRSSAPPVVVVNDAAAKRFWPGKDPVGARLALTGSPVVFTVVGVTGDVRQSDLGRAPRAEIFLCALQPGPDWSSFALVVNAADPLALVPAVRASVRAVNRDVAIAKIGTMNQVIAGRLAAPLVYTTLLGTFAGLALALAAVGLYGVVGYAVAQRTREMGIRAALGSTQRGLVFSVMKGSALMIGAGVVIGLAAAQMVTRAIGTLIAGARPEDPVTYVLVAIMMIVVGGAASYIPARRAARVDPLTALRAE